MNNTAELLTAIKKLSDKNEFSESLSLLGEFIDSFGVNPELLVKKGQLIKLSDDCLYSLGDAVKCFNEALEIDKLYVDAYEELGWHYLNVLDNPRESKVFFQKGLEAAQANGEKERYFNVFKGFVESVAELAGVNEARNVIKCNDIISSEEKKYMLSVVVDGGVIFWD